MLAKLILTCAASVASWLSWLSFSPSECVRWRRRELRLGRDGTEPARDRNQPASAVSPLVVGGGPPVADEAVAAGDWPRGVVWGAAGGVRPKGEGERPLLREEEPRGISMNLVSEEVLLRPEELEDVEIWRGGADQIWGQMFRCAGIALLKFCKFVIPFLTGGLFAAAAAAAIAAAAVAGVTG